jgi:3-phosphoshikimate 1-carboxyvinyltransferase
VKALSTPEGAQRVSAVAAAMNVTFLPGQILLEGTDATDAVRTERAGMAASRVSATVPGCGRRCWSCSTAAGALPGLVADGRDMGTVIFPQATLKVFLTASAETRAERRYKQLISKGNPAKLESLLLDLKARDERDSQRAHAPLKPAEDAFLLDNSAQTIEESVAAGVGLVGSEASLRGRGPLKFQRA